MFKSYLKIALRSLLRDKSHSLINILGLAVGLAATIFIVLSIRFELSYESFQRHADRLFRVSVIDKKEGKIQSDSPVFTPPIGPAMQRDFPEVEKMARMSTRRVAYLSYKERALKVDGISHADSTFFELFSFELLVGNPQRALTDPYAIVLTEPVAARIFGSENPLGQTIKLDDRDSYVVTGIAKAPPANSHIQFNALISFSTLYKNPELFLGWDGGNQYITYVQLAKGASAKSVNAKFPDFMWGYINKEYANYGIRLEPYLQPLPQIHLYYEPDSETQRSNLYVFAAVAVLILFIACMNFVNLSVARATKRAKEVGVRKVLGGDRRMLARQFLGESVLLVTLAFVLALLFVELLLPFQQSLFDRQLTLFGGLDWTTALALLAILLLVAFGAGGYPAFYLSSLRPAGMLRASGKSPGNRSGIRNVLVILQFAISIALIVCTFAVNNQLAFLKQKDIGFDKDNIIVLPLIGQEVQARHETLKQALLGISTIADVAACSEVPHRGLTSNGYFPEGHDKTMMIHVVDVDNKLLKTFGIEVVQGRAFSREFATDNNAFLINETLAKTLGWTDPVGKTIRRNGDHPVIGVVKDFHFATLHSQIEPLIITNQPARDRFAALSIKVKTTDYAGTLAAIKAVWQDIAPTAPFDYWFLDEAFDQLYKSEQRFRTLFLGFSALAIAIALSGLLSLAAFATAQRTKEIGVRKVLGASAANITALLSRDFIKLVLLANLIAWPIAWLAMHRWLQNFAYRIEIGWWIFVLAGGLALLIALLTVSAQAMRAALVNPVESLHYE